MDRKGSKHEDSYKGHKSSGIDRRALRAHRRSLEWKSLRTDEANKRRNLSKELSPVREVKPATAIESRRERLKRWQAEKELKRKLGAQDAKKNVFKVTKVQHEYVPFKKPKTDLPPVAKGTKPTKNSATAVTSAASKRPTRNEAAKPETRVTRARVPPQPSAPASGRKVQEKKAAQKTAPAPPLAAASRVTRSRKSSQVTHEPAKPVGTRTTSVSKSEKTTAAAKASKPQKKSDPKPKADVSLDTKKVNTRRGESATIELESSTFKFTAPDNVQPFVFKPLSPNSAASFTFVTTVAPPSPQGRRCSTPKVSSLKRSSVMQSPSASVILEGSTDTSTTDTNSGEDVKSEEDQDAKPSPAKIKTPSSVRRRTSEARSTTSESGDKKTNSSAAQRRKSRVQALRDEDSGTSSSESDTKSRRRSTRRSLALKAAESEVAMDTTDSEIISSAPRSSRRSMRRSTASSTISQVDTEDMDTEVVEKEEEKETHSSGDSVQSDAAEENKDVDGEKEVAQVQLEASAAAVPAASESCEEPSASPHKLSPKLINNQEAEQIPAKTLFATPAPVKPDAVVMEKKGGTRSAEREAEVAFHTPASVPRRLRARSVTPANALSIAKRKDLRRSFVLKGLSPEEGVEILKLSPMIEMKRRTPKPSKLGFAPVLDFSDIDEMLQADAATAAVDVNDDASKSGVQTAEAANEEKKESAEDDGAESKSDVEPAATQVEQAASVPSEKVVVQNEEPTKQQEEEDIAKHDVKYFRDQMESERNHMTELCAKWTEISENTNDIPDDVGAEIRTNVGKTELLMRGRFKQFGGLVDKCEQGADGEGGQTMTCMDLQGFWDMVYNQIDEVYLKFEKLSKMQSNSWVDVDKPVVVKKKVLKKKPAAVKPTAKPAAAKSKFAEFRRAKMLAQKKAEPENTENVDVVVEEPQPKSTDSGEEKKKTPAKSKFAEFRAKLLAEKKKLEESSKATAIEEIVDADKGGIVLAGAQSPPTVVTDDSTRTESGQPVKVFEAGFFAVHSPVRKSPLPSLEGTPVRKSSSRPLSISAHNTPSMSPMAKAVLERSAKFSARRSGSIGAMLSASASGKLDPSPSDLMVPSPLVRDTSGSGSFIASRSWTQSYVPKVEASIFTPDSSKTNTPTRASKSSRRSVLRPAFNLPPKEEQAVDAEPQTTSPVSVTGPVVTTTGDDFLSKYLMPSSQATDADSATTDTDVDQEMEVTDETPISDDAHMVPPIRTRLAAQFDVPLEKVLQTPAAAPVDHHDAEASGTRPSRRNRRSVHFSGDADGAHDMSLIRAPVTPYNRDSLVPRRRVNSTSDKDQKENLNVISTPPFIDGVKLLPISASPATRLSKLDVNAPTPIARAKQRFSGLPFTPPHHSAVTAVLPSVGEDDSPNLMCFSPLGSSAVNTPKRSTRRSTRLSTTGDGLI